MMKKHNIYKLKEGVTLGRPEEMWTKTVIVEYFACDPTLDNEVALGVMAFIDPSTMQYQGMLGTRVVLSYEDFEDYFEPYMTQSEVNQRILKLNNEE